MNQNAKNNNIGRVLYDMNILLPNTVCKLLACATILINMQWSKNQEVQLVGMGVATLFSFVFGYLVIISLNLGLTYEISRKKNRSTQVGIYYQRALLINFIICAFIVTPILYISKNIIVLFMHIDVSLSQIISEYLFQLVPSIYCFAFFDTTQTYLLAQEIYLAPLVINIFAVFAHYIMIQYLGAAWSKNFTDIGCCLAIYIYIRLRKNQLDSWVEWTIRCIQGWANHMRFLEIIGMTTYLQSFFLFVFSIVAHKLDIASLVCHICFLNIYQILFLLNIGLKEGVMTKIGFQLNFDKYRLSKKLGISIIKLFFTFSLIFSGAMLIYMDQIINFFIVKQSAKQQFRINFWIFLAVLIVDSLKTGLSALLKSLNQNYSLFKINIFFLGISCTLGYIMCYKFQQGLSGLWWGWLLGSILHILTNWIFLLRIQKKANRRH